jgi:AraC-like DNA-binding protein
MIYIEYTPESYFEVFQAFAEKLYCNVENNRAILQPETGEGYLKYIHVFDGVELIIANFCLFENALFRRLRSKQNNYVLRIDNLDETKRMIINDDDGESYIHSIGTYFFLARTLTDYEFYLPARTYNRNIHVFFSPAWLANEFRERNEQHIMVKYLNLPPEQQFIPLNHELQKLYDEIIDTPLSDGLYDIKITARALKIVEELFLYFRQVLHQKKPDHENELHVDDIERLEKVEKMITGLYADELPPIDHIAKEVAMSTSTLQRKFKKMFNYGIYEYYQNYRLQEARKLLMVEQMNAKDVAYKLGFKDPSHFTRAYKKRFGFTPGKTT